MMASLAAACRISSRLARRKVVHDVAARGFRTSSTSFAAQNFTMPALSPTMTEGNIAAWRVKEGEKYVAGDVLLEIETDKASMDVEAQEDGVMVKIMHGDGTKSIQVGARIAVIGEEGDDPATLEIPQEEKPKESESSSAAPKEEKSADTEPKEAKPAEGEKKAARKTAGTPQKQKYPLYPSVQGLLKEHGVEASKVDEIIATGPQGRLLKGDVLAYLGLISESAPEKLSAQFNKLSHLDLSNIKVGKAPAAPKKAESKAATPAAPTESLVTLPISLAAVIEVQKKIQDTLDVFVPLSTFVERAADVANDDLPRSPLAKPSANELFNEVLGLDKVGPRGSQGFYIPQIAALPPTSMSVPRTIISGPAAPRKKMDIIDVLAGNTSARPAKRFSSGVSTGINVFSLNVPHGDEKRAKVFLERIKVVLEKESSRLVVL